MGVFAKFENLLADRMAIYASHHGIDLILYAVPHGVESPRALDTDVPVRMEYTMGEPRAENSGVLSKIENWGSGVLRWTKKLTTIQFPKQKPL